MRTLLLTCFAIVVLAVSAPGLITRHIDKASSVREELGALLPEPAAPPAPQVGDRQVTIEADDDGHFYVHADIGFRPVRLMVDTGATIVALRRSDAEAAGIRPVAADFRVPVATANGTAYAAEAEIDSIIVRDIEVTDVRALVLPDEQLGVSLLGASFLNRLARYEVKGGSLIFEN